MSDPQVTAPVLTEHEAATIARTLVLLRAINMRSRYSAIDAGDKADAYRLGQLSEAADTADDVLFNVLNTAASHLDCPASRDAITRLNAHSIESGEPAAEASPA